MNGFCAIDCTKMLPKQATLHSTNIFGYRNISLLASGKEVILQARHIYKTGNYKHILRREKMNIFNTKNYLSVVFILL